MEARDKRPGGAARRERAAGEVLGALDTDFFRALAEPTRIELLRVLLVRGACDVAALAAEMPQDRSVLSRHLQVLLRAGLVSCRRAGRHRVYTLRGPAFLQRVEGLAATLRRVVPACCPGDGEEPASTIASHRRRSATV